MTAEHTIEWLFDGVGGATLLALGGFAYHKFRAHRDMRPTKSTASESLGVVAEDRSVAVGPRSNVQTSPVVYGSHNTINIAHHPRDARAEEAKEEASRANEKKDEEFPIAEVLSVLLGVPTFLMLVVAMMWAAIHPGTVRGVLEGNTAASTIAFQYGTGIAVADYSLGNQVTGCSDARIVCLGEDYVSHKTISIPELPSGNWSRIAVFVTYTEGGDSSEVLVSTSSNDVELNYAGHRDGSTHRRLEFRMDEVKAISETQKSYWFPVDIAYRDPGVRFPITVTVNEDKRHAHSATATFEIARLPPVAPRPERATKSPSGADSRQITVAERVTAITSQFTSVAGIRPESDFEVDLGMSPIAVSVLLGQFEEEYGITVPKNESLKIRTVGQAIRYIEARVGHK